MKPHLRRYHVNPGDRFEKWTVIREVDVKAYECGQGHRMVLCRCSCEHETEVAVDLYHLVNGVSRSCRRCMNDPWVTGLTLLGKRVPVRVALKHNGVSREAYDKRRERGWSVVDAATKPMQPRRNRV